MDGFWTVEFRGVQGMGNGVVTLIRGQLFGGDISFLYRGTYTQQGQTLTARVNVNRYASGVASVMGQDSFALELRGMVSGSSAVLAGSIPGTPLKFEAAITKQGDLPAM